MKGVSLWQPWASAMALGWKGNETRHWSTAYRGPMVIHAAKRWTSEERTYAAIMCTGLTLPLGVLVAVGELVDVVRTELIRDGLSELELQWGNYDDGRFAWIFKEVRALPAPIPFKGMQGLFEVPDELLGATPTAPLQGVLL